MVQRDTTVTVVVALKIQCELYKLCNCHNLRAPPVRALVNFWSTARQTASNLSRQQEVTVLAECS